MIVYNNWNLWVSGLCPSSSIPRTLKHNISETGSLFLIGGGGGDTYSAGSFRRSVIEVGS
jgi:hypothetical protein